MILLDTHAWIWFVSNPELLSEKAKKSIGKALKNKSLFVSSISVWEVALLVLKGRLNLKMDVADWIAKSENLSFIQFVPVDNSIALKSVNLTQPLHNDPADRIIIATAMTMGFFLVTKDEKILNYQYVKCIW